MSATHFLGIDLGAESGRVILGTLEEGKLTLDEIHRFPNRVIETGKSLTWNLPELEAQIFTGLEKAAQRGLPIAGLSADSWGVDYVLLDANNQPVAPPSCYRDPRTESSTARFFKKLSPAEIYAETGIQIMAINTLFQFEAQQHDDPAVLGRARRFLNMADYFNSRLSGVATAEQSLASTSQIYNPQKHDWSAKLVKTLGLDSSFFPPVVPSGTVLGPVTPSLQKYPALAGAKVVASCSHDTGAAVAAVPARSDSSWAYLSSGTWSLLGAEVATPVMTEEAREAGFTNEVGLGGTIRLLKNIAGLWVVQECRRTWEAEGKAFGYDELARLATESGPTRAHLSLEDPRFFSREDMPKKIAAFCAETGQPAPASPGETVRVVLESLALTYARTLRDLERLLDRRFETLHVVGGGSRNDLLNQLTADALGLNLVTGPVEATAIGNILIQALALGHLASAAELRRVAGASFPTRTFSPRSTFSLEVHDRFQKLRPTPLSS